jgi:CRP-like cAMP-binding protein
MADFALSPQLKAELERIAATTREATGTILFQRGQPVSGVYLVRNGKVDLSLESKKQVYPTRTLGPGCILGLPATMSGAAYSLTATVNKNAELGFVSREAFLKLMAANTSLCLEAMNLLSQEISSIRSAMSFETAAG